MDKVCLRLRLRLNKKFHFLIIMKEKDYYNYIDDLFERQHKQHKNPNLYQYPYI